MTEQRLLTGGSARNRDELEYRVLNISLLVPFSYPHQSATTFMSQSATSEQPKQPVSSKEHSPSVSTQLERHNQGEASTETLVGWLVAAKRSLSSIHYVQRATTILAEARSIIESTAALIARTKYLRRSLHSQLKILRGVQFELEGSAHDVKQEIHTTKYQLESVDKRLKQNIETLQRTKIEDGFRSSRISGGEQKKFLHDFVDDGPVLSLEGEIESIVAVVETIQDHVNTSIREFEDQLQGINEILADRTATSSSTKSDLQPLDISRQMRSLENNASMMARSLESLVSHYDLCVTAIKHTEDAGVVVARQITTARLAEEVGRDLEMHETETPMSEEERIEMIKVLAHDADQVDDETMEIADRAVTMESQLERLRNWQLAHRSAHRDVSDAFRLMENVSRQLHMYLQEIHDFNQRWQEERVKLVDSMMALQDLSVTYESFLSSYDYMIVEADRRRRVRRNMEKVIATAQTQLDRLYEEDVTERELFRGERGDFLPNDIWDGLDSIPPQYTWQRTSETGIDSVPELDKSIVSAAVRRLKASMMEPTGQQ